MNKALRNEDVNPDNVISYGKTNIEYIEPTADGVSKGKGFISVTADAKSVKEYPVEIFGEHVDGSLYIYAGDKYGNIFEHLNGYVGLWIKANRD